VLTNFYSFPLPMGVEVQAKVYSAYEIWTSGQTTFEIPSPDEVLTQTAN
jgi:hypothetical protein